MSELVALLVAGLGIFFLGVELVATGFQDSGSRGLRALIRRSTKNRPWCAALGVLSGAMMQSTGAVAGVLGSMASSGMITVRQALPILAFANVGISALVFVGAFDVRLAALYGIGLFGISYSLATGFRWRSLSSIALGLGLLLYGGTLVTNGASGMLQTNWFAGLIASGRGSALLALAFGALASFLTQSTSAIALFAVALASSRLLGGPEAMMMIYGANVGSTFMRMLLSRGRSGLARQISGFQDLFKLTGTGLFIGLFYLEFLGRVPAVGALVGWLTPEPALQMALVNLLLNGTMVAAFGFVGGPVERMLARRWPPSSAEDLSAPKFIDHEALGDPETAIDLLEKELARIVSRLGDHLADLRDPAAGRPGADPAERHRSFLSLGLDLEHFHTAIVGLHLAAATSERLSNVHARMSLAMLVEDSLNQLAATLRSAPRDGPIGKLSLQFLEAVDLLLLLTRDAVLSLDREDLATLQELCSDRSEQMGRIRNLHLAPEQELPLAERGILLTLTSLFERIVWMLRRYALLLEQSLE